jgi:hypothetical protein
MRSEEVSVPGTIDPGEMMQRRVTRTVFFVFLTLLIEVVYLCTRAFSFSGITGTLKTECGQCDDCQSVAMVLAVWFEFNPQIRMMVGFFSAPVALLLALYGMLGQQERKVLFSGNTVPLNSCSPSTPRASMCYS